MTVVVQDLGELAPPPPALQSGMHHPLGHARPCVHLLTPEPPAVLSLDWSAVGRLNFQPRLCTPPVACIASRIGDVLTISFDAGHRQAVRGPHHRLDHPDPNLRWHYQLHATDNPNVVAAVMIPPAAVTRPGTN